MKQCDNCKSEQEVQTMRNPFNPHRILCLCDICCNIPFKDLKKKITLPWWEYEDELAC